MYFNFKKAKVGLGFASLGKGGGTDVPEGLTSLKHRKEEILNSDNFLVLSGKKNFSRHKKLFLQFVNFFLQRVRQTI